MITLEFRAVVNRAVVMCVFVRINCIVDLSALIENIKAQMPKDTLYFMELKNSDGDFLCVIHDPSGRETYSWSVYK